MTSIIFRNNRFLQLGSKLWTNGMSHIHVSTFCSFSAWHSYEQSCFAVNNFNIMDYKTIVKGYCCIRSKLSFNR